MPYETDVQKIYIAYYGRAADPAGLQYWAERLETAGNDLTPIVNDFGTSPEYVARYGEMTDSELVNNLYVQLFNRDAEPAGLNFYVGRLTSGHSTLAEIALDILNGAQGDDLKLIDRKILIAEQVTEKIDFLQSETDTIFYSDNSDAETVEDFISDVDRRTTVDNDDLLELMYSLGYPAPNYDSVSDQMVTVKVEDVPDLGVTVPGGEVITGDDQNNVLVGGYGNDTISGGGGDDTLHGGRGSDTLTGGTGDDRFTYAKASEFGDTILDFNRAQGDVIVLDIGTANLFSKAVNTSIANSTAWYETLHVLAGNAAGTAIALADSYTATFTYWYETASSVITAYTSTSSSTPLNRSTAILDNSDAGFMNTTAFKQIITAWTNPSTGTFVAFGLGAGGELYQATIVNPATGASTVAMSEIQNMATIATFPGITDSNLLNVVLI